MNRNLSLLEFLADRTSCTYLSDLHQDFYLPAIHKIITDIDPENFPLCQWQDALKYLKDIDLSFSSCHEAKDFFLKNI